MAPSPFEALCDELAEMQAQRTVRESAARAARHAAEAQRNRRMARPQPQRTLRKSAPPPDYKPDWDGLAARQEQIASDLEQSRIQAQRDAIRAHLSVLRQAARAGRLSSFEAAKYDALVGQALRMGINP